MMEKSEVKEGAELRISCLARQVFSVVASSCSTLAKFNTLRMQLDKGGKVSKTD
jgi:hypothetical protein